MDQLPDTLTENENEKTTEVPIALDFGWSGKPV